MVVILLKDVRMFCRFTNGECYGRCRRQYFYGEIYILPANPCIQLWWELSISSISDTTFEFVNIFINENTSIDSVLYNTMETFSMGFRKIRI